MRRRLSILLLISAAPPLQAQTLPLDSVAPGGRVRVGTPSPVARQVTGILVERTADSLIVVVPPAPPQYQRTREAVALRDIATLEIARSSRGHALVGALYGGALGALLSIGAAQQSGNAGAAVLLFGIVAGGASGAIIGSRLATTTWVRIQ